MKHNIPPKVCLRIRFLVPKHAHKKYDSTYTDGAEYEQ